MGQATYLFIDLASLAVPLLASFHPRLRFHDRWFAFWPACILTAVLFVAWDSVFTQWGIWSFSDRYTLGLRYFSLPLEELLFFVCIPYASMFTYHCLNVLGLRSPSVLTARTIALLGSLALVLFAVVFPERLYTSITFALAGVFLYVLARSSAAWLGPFLRAYLVVLIPFFIVNGLLTGSMLDEAVVRYNDAHTLGIRLGTIPIEDVVYGMLMLLMNTAIYEYLVARRLRTEHQERTHQA